MAMTPEEILALHKSYADQFSSLAQSGLTGAFNALSTSGIFDYTPASISIAMPSFGQPNRNIALPSLPEDPKLPELDELEEHVDIPNPDALGSAPLPFFGASPTYSAPPTPGNALPDFTAAEPADPDNVTLPALPPYLSLPALSLPYPTVDIPDAPVITTPIFDGMRPDEIEAPDPNVLVGVYREEKQDHRAELPTFVQGVSDALIAQYAPEFPTLRSRINTAVTDYTHPTTGGGLSTPSHVEAAIYARASDRNAQEYIRAVDSTMTEIASRGFTLPPGALAGAIRKARMAMGDAQVRASTEIATKNVEMEQQTFQFMLKLGAALEEKMLDLTTSYLQLALKMDEQAISSAKELLAAYIGAYNVQAMVYRAAMEGYQADASVYRAKIEAMLGLVRVYEAEIRAEMAKTEVNTAHVNVLRAVADVNQSLANTYKAQVDAAMAPLEAARLRVAIYEAKARAYAAQVGGFEARWNAYRAQVDGELGKFRGYEAQVNGYTAQVNGYKAQVDAYSAKVNALAETNRSIATSNESKVKVFAAQAEAAVSVFNGQIAGFTAESNAAVKQAEIEVEYWRANANLIFQEYNVALQQTFEFAREQMNLFRGQMEAAINAANGLAQAAQVAGNLAGGAMQGLTSFAGRLVSSEE